MGIEPDELKPYHVFHKVDGEWELVGYFDDLVQAEELADTRREGMVQDTAGKILYQTLGRLTEQKDNYPILHETREAWLDALVAKLRDWFTVVGKPLPDVIKTSPGWPPKGGMAPKARVRGTCMYGTDKSAHVFLNPTEDIPQDIFGIMLHELVHAAIGPRKNDKEKGGHGPDFKALGLKVGLAGKPKEMWPKDEITQQFTDRLLPELGWYPHIRLDPETREKPQSTRMLKVECDGTRHTPDGNLETRLAHDTYKLRGSKTQLERGVPLCPVCGLDMRVDWPETDEKRGTKDE
jgi:hypothetical protein